MCEHQHRRPDRAASGDTVPDLPAHGSTDGQDPVVSGLVQDEAAVVPVEGETPRGWTEPSEACELILPGDRALPLFGPKY